MAHLFQATDSIKRHNISPLVALKWVALHGVSVLLILLLSSAAAAQLLQNARNAKELQETSRVSTDQEGPPKLKLGNPIERDMRGDEAYADQVQLLSGQFAHFVIEQQGIDVVPSLFGRAGRKAAEIDNAKETKERGDLTLLLNATGSYRSEIRPSNKATATRHYALRIAQQRTGTEHETLTLKAKNLMSEAENLEAKRIENIPLPLSRERARPGHYFELSLKIIEKYEEALELWRRVADRQRVADTLYMIGQSYFFLGDLHKSRTYYEQSLHAWRSAGDNGKQLLLFNRIGDVQTKLGEYERALDSFNQGLQLAQNLSLTDRANSLTNIGELFYHLGQFQKSLDYYSQALLLWRETHDNAGEVRTRNNINLVESAQPALRNPVRGRLELVLQTGHSGIINALAVSPDGRFLASGGTDNSVKLWEVAEGRELRILTNHLNTVTCVKFTPDGHVIASASYDGTIKLIEIDTGTHLRTLTGFSNAVSAIAFSPDGRFLVAGSFERTLKVWDVSTGRELRTFVGHKHMITAVNFSPDGRIIASGGGDAAVKIWDAASARELRTLTGHMSIVTSVAFTPDGKSVISGGMNSELKLWDVVAGRVVRDFVGHYFQINSIAISHDGRWLISAGGSGTINDSDSGLRVWDVTTGVQLRHLADKDRPFQTVSFSRDGSLLIAGGSKPAIQLWDVSTWEPRPNAFANHLAEVTGTAFSADGALIASRSEDGIRLWNTASGNKVRTLSRARSSGSMSMSADGRLVAAEDNEGVSIWDTATERVLHTFKVFLPKTSYSFPDTGEKISGLQSIAFSKDGRLLALGSDRRKPVLLDITSGKEPDSWKGTTLDAAPTPDFRHKFNCYAIAFSPDGRFIASAVQEIEENIADRSLTIVGNTVSIWEVRTGVASSVRLLETVTALSFSPDGRWLAAGTENNTIRIGDVYAGEELRVLTGHSGGVNFVTFSPDGRLLAAAAGSEVKLWDTRSWRDRSLQGHTNTVTSVSFAADGQRLVSSSQDGSTRIWKVETGEELAKLVSLDTDSWAVVTPDGHFDASSESMKLMHWNVGSEAIALEQLKERYYEPGLLAKIMGFNLEPLRPINADKKIELFPLVEVARPAPENAKLTINLTNRGGGIGRVQVWVNEKEVAFDARPPKFDPHANKATLTLDLTKSSYFVGRKNDIKVLAFNAEGYLSSREIRTVWLPQGDVEDRPPELYAIIAGISKYTSSELNLRFAAKDADDMSKAIALGAKRLFGAERVHLTLLSTSGESRAVAPTKANFKKAFEEATKARPSDILVVYFAGHGITRENSDTYYYLTKEARNKDSSALSDPDVRGLTTISSDELAEWVRQIPALKQVMILDTCAAGAAAGKLIDKRNVPADQIRAIERLKDRTGFHVLMGSAASDVSYEASEYGQGLLTYALLQGMYGAALRDEEYVDVQKLFQYAADEVPKLAAGVGGIQRPTIAAPRGTSFDVGRFISEDKSAIPLAISKPVILPPLLLNADEGADALSQFLNKELRRRLRDESYALFETRSQPRFVYLDADEFKGAIRPSGTYRLESERVIIALHIRKDDRILSSVTIEGSKNDVAGLVSKIMEAIIVGIKNY